MGWKASVVNPARLKGFAQSQLSRNKTDKADAKLLALFAQRADSELLGYTGSLAAAAAQAKAAGISVVPQTGTANKVGAIIEDLLKRRDVLASVIEKAESMHDDPAEQAKLLTGEGTDAMARAREKCDDLELMVSDSEWPLPKYREMLFPV